MTNAAKLTQRLNVLLDRPLMRQLRDHAKKEEQSLGDITRSALMEYLTPHAVGCDCMRCASAPQPTTGGDK